MYNEATRGESHLVSNIRRVTTWITEDTKKCNTLPVGDRIQTVGWRGTGEYINTVKGIIEITAGNNSYNNK